MTTNNELADRFFGALERQDFGALAETYTPDMIVWHNVDQKEKSFADSIQIAVDRMHVLEWFKYITDRHIDIEDGFVRQMRFEGMTKAGQHFSQAQCIVCTTRDGKISRIDRYFDSPPGR